MAKFAHHMEKIAGGVAEGYQKIEDGVLTGYKKIKADMEARNAAQKEMIEKSLEASRNAGKRN